MSIDSASRSPGATEEDGRARVAEVDRSACALILADQWPEKVGKGLMFISLNVEPATHEAEVAAIDAVGAELEARGVPVKDGGWGYRLLMTGTAIARRKLHRDARP